ncbi:MAG: cyclophilin-like fold protein [Thermodesulfobacteriota bacterium]
MRIEVDGARFDVELYEGNAVRELMRFLPQRISMSRWGDEFYGALKGKIDPAGDPVRDVFEVGEVAFWPPGNALCIFFGPTPASRGTEPRMASPGVALGKIRGDATAFRRYGATLKNVEIAA